MPDSIMWQAEDRRKVSWAAQAMMVKIWTNFEKGEKSADAVEEDAIFAARRHIELACAQRNGQVMLLALDWKKAFDSVNVDALLNA